NSLKSLRMVTFLQRTFTSLVHTHAGRTQRSLFDTYQGQIREQQNRQVTSLLDTSFYRLEQIALMIPALSEAAITQQNLTLGKKLERFFNIVKQHWKLIGGLNKPPISVMTTSFSLTGKPENLTAYSIS
ncbi:MAG: hypothetical protein KZQ78_13705, partial [Candidatus Thiodiazotropha sp. (ex Ustalcina ferruginea)]|nr:hypothetical protein [Candidatus Thiodiazotropha sp. (ex Ustalcina ferruginea)]